MDRKTRERVGKIAKSLVGASECVQESLSELEMILSGEEAKLDNLPDSLRCSGTGERIETGVECLSEAVELLSVGEDIMSAADSLRRIEGVL